MGKKSNQGSKVRKAGRAKRKREGRTKPLSLFVRDKISAAAYFKLTKQG